MSQLYDSDFYLWPDNPSVDSWVLNITASRYEIADLLSDSPSLKSHFKDLMKNSKRGSLARLSRKSLSFENKSISEAREEVRKYTPTAWSTEEALGFSLRDIWSGVSPTVEITLPVKLHRKVSKVNPEEIENSIPYVSKK